MATVIPQDDQPLSGDSRVLLHEIANLQRQVAGLRKDSPVDFVMSLGSPEPGTVLAHGYLGPRIKRTLVEGVEVPEVVVADTARGFVLYTVQPAQVKPGTDEIWLDIKCGKVTIEYEGDEPAVELAEDGQLIVMKVNAGTVGRPVDEIAKAFGADEYGTARCNTSLEAVIDAAYYIHCHQAAEAAERVLRDRVNAKS